MTHGRAQVHDMTVGARRDGTLGGLRVRGWADVGAYPVRGRVHPDGDTLHVSRGLPLAAA